MENKNNKMWIWIGVVVVVVLIGWWAMQKSPATPVVEDSTEVTPTEDTTDGSVNATTPAAALSYQQALTKYKDARIQLDGTCQASPKAVTYKNGTSIMLDNRAAVSRNVKLGSTFSIKGYGFKIVKLSSGTLPATWFLDCGTSQNVATVLIQK